MNVGGSFDGGYGEYRPKDSSSYSSRSGGDASQKDKFEAPRQTMTYGDSLVVSSLGRRENRARKSSPEKTIDRLKKGRIACWIIGAIGFFAFGILAVQPILLPLCTLGMCGWSDWLEFTRAIFKMSLIPASFGALFVGAGFFCDHSLKAIEEQLNKQEKVKLAPEFVELMLRQGQMK